MGIKKKKHYVMPKKIIHILMIHHRHGTDVSVSFSEKKIYKELYDYVKDNWDTDGPGSTKKIPKKQESAVIDYFSSNEESYDISTSVII
jgi:hypothetical protein